jgi:methylase of polypeptide subunit release factors
LAENSIVFIEGDLFAAFDKSGAPENAVSARGSLPRRFGLVVSNPPYVPAPVIPSLPPEVRREPRLALDGGEDGLALIRRITAESPDHLTPGGALLLEADPRQMETISGILASCGYSGVKIYSDLSQRPRVIRGFLRSPSDFQGGILRKCL